MSIDPPANGRVDVLKNDNYKMYGLFAENNTYRNAGEEALRSILSKNEISDLFFSRKNIDYIQDAIRYLVYDKSCKKHIIDRQSETELVIIMRSIYLQYTQSQPYKVAEQVKQMNTQVLNYCVPRILQEINQYLYYRNDIASLPIPMDRGQFMSTKGSKVLEQNF